MKRYAQALAFIFARAPRNQLITQLEYLRIENQILRSKLPKKIRITPGERARLLKFGKPPGPAIRQLISIVHPRTFARWKAEERDGRPRHRHMKDGSKGGRPRKTQFIRDLVVRMARENDWGLTRIADAGAKTKRLPKCSPSMNAFAERFVQTLKHECLNHFIVFGERHLDHLVSEFVDYYHTSRPHQGIDNATPIRSRDGPGAGPVRCDSRLGGVLKHYYRAA